VATTISRPNILRLLSLGYLKQVVYSNRPQAIEELKQNTEVSISNISKETLKKVVGNMVTCVNTCYTENDGHFQHLL
jgi:hypothetical protein